MDVKPRSLQSGRVCDRGAAEPVKTVFVVDDDLSVRRGLRRLLQSSGYAVEECSSADEFLQREAPDGPSCVVLDVRMPRMTGPELFDRIVESGSALPVIFLTGHADVPTSVHVMKEGAVDFLVKPVDEGTLLRAVGNAIERHAAERARAVEREANRARLARLSAREREVMDFVVRGVPNKRAAAELGITEKTVKVHRHRVMEKTGAASVPDLVRLADAAAMLAPAPGAPGEKRRS